MQAILVALLAGLWLMPVLAGPGIRDPAVSGAWYPADPKELSELVQRLLGPESAESRPRPLAIIAPHAGFSYSGASAGKVYGKLRGARYQRVLLLGPSHHGRYRGLATTEAQGYATPLGVVKVDEPAITQLRRSTAVSVQPEAERREHSLEAQLPFLQAVLAPGWRLVPLMLGQMEGDEFAQAADLLRPLLDDGTLVVVSTDFTHYGPRFDYLPFPNDDRVAERLKALDMGAFDAIAAGDPKAFLAYLERSGITLCGHNPVALLLHLFKSPKVELVDYQTSGALGQDYSHSVSYVSAILSHGNQGLSAAEMALLHRIASAAVRAAVNGGPDSGEALESLEAGLSPRLKELSGAFVTLREGERLRGCYGYIEPVVPLFQAVIDNGRNAAVRDPRFKPVRGEELPGLSLEVSVLTRPQPIGGPEQFQVGQQGIILRKDGRRAVFLPEVATEFGWDRGQTLSELARKAGLPTDAWKSDAHFEVFTSQTWTAPLVVR